MPACLSDLGARLYPVCLAASLSVASVAQCELIWQAAAPLAGASNRVNAIENVPGHGLYIAGMFEAVGDVFANRVAMWDGNQWHAMGSGVDRSANTMAVAPSGDLVVGGFFTTAGGTPAAHLAKWDGAAWSEFGGGANGVVNCLSKTTSGVLLAGGTFTAVGGQSAKRAAVWDGTSWAEVGTGITTGDVEAIAMRPNGNIAVGGRYMQAAGTSAGGLVIWNGANWIDPGLHPGAWVYSLEIDVNGDLLIGGLVLDGQGSKFARWDGTSLQFLSPPTSLDVRSILVEPSGSILVGSSASLGTGTGNSIVRLDNGSWSVVKSGSQVRDMTHYNGKLIAAGGFISAAGESNVSEYDGTSWSSIDGHFATAKLEHIAPAADGGVYVAGILGSIGTVTNPKVAHWDGSNWTALGSGLDIGWVTDMVTTSNDDLIVSGFFTAAGGTPASHIASWNGSNWATLGAGLPAPARKLLALRSGAVVAAMFQGPLLRVFDSGVWTTLPDPPVSAVSSMVEMPNGDLAVASGTSGGVVRWDGSSWTTISTKILHELTVKPDGTLVGAGLGVFEWDGSAFQPVGPILLLLRDVIALPNGDLIASGVTDFGAQSIGSGIIRWDGANWVPVDLGTGISLTAPNSVEEMVFTAAGELVVVGRFGSIGNTVTGNIGRATSTCPATVNTFGAGCWGSAGAVSMTAQNMPWLGATFEAEATGMAPVSLAVQVVGTAPSLAPLPMGAPGCLLFVSPAQLTLAVPSNGAVTTNFAIPATAALVGLSVRTQTIGIELDASMAITSLTSSNALTLTLGAL